MATTGIEAAHPFPLPLQASGPAPGPAPAAAPSGPSLPPLEPVHPNPAPLPPGPAYPHPLHLHIHPAPAAPAPAPAHPAPAAIIHDRKTYTEFFKKIMTPINALGGKINCGRVALKLNALLTDLPRLMIKPESELAISPVGTQNGHQWFHFKLSADETHLTSMSTSSEALIKRASLETFDFKTVKDPSGTTKLIIDLTDEDGTQTQVALKKATYDTIVSELIKLPRRAEDNAAFGIIVYTHKTEQGTVSKEELHAFHTANFFVDGNNKVYFLDAQPHKDVYVSDKPLPGYLHDLCFLASTPLLKAAPSPSPDTEIKVKKERPSDIIERTYTDFPSSYAKVLEEFKKITPEEFKKLQESAAQKDPKSPIPPKALFYLATCHHNGLKGFPKNEVEAVRLLKAAADQGYPPAQCSLAMNYANGTGNLTKNEVEAVKLFKAAADQGYAPAVYNLGTAYLNGAGELPQNKEQAIELFKKAAAQGYMPAHALLKQMEAPTILPSSQYAPWSISRKVVEELEKLSPAAFKTLQTLATQKDPKAQFQLGMCYQHGLAGLTQDLKKASECFHSSAALGNALARIQLANLYENGLPGVIARNQNTSFLYCQLAAAQEFAPAQDTLASYHFNGIPGVLDKDQKKAVELWTASATQEYPPAQHTLANLYFKGISGILDKDQKKAVELWRSSAKQGYANAQYNLGTFYFKGIPSILDKDQKKAVELWRSSAKQGYATAQMELGLAYITGIPDILDKDQKEGIELLMASVKQGFAQAQNHLGFYYYHGIPNILDKDRKKTIELWTASVKQGFAPAQYNLGKLYLSGIPDILNKDPKKAIELLKQAATQGLVEAQVELEQQEKLLLKQPLPDTSKQSKAQSEININSKKMEELEKDNQKLKEELKKASELNASLTAQNSALTREVTVLKLGKRAAPSVDPAPGPGPAGPGPFLAFPRPDPLNPFPGPVAGALAPSDGTSATHPNDKSDGSNKRQRK